MLACEPVPTLHLRNVPDHVYEALRDRARLNRRSLTAEAIAILEAEVAPPLTGAEFLAELQRLAFELPEGAPSPEEVIRATRDAGAY